MSCRNNKSVRVFSIAIVAGLFLAVMPAAQAGVEISEFMAKNESILTTTAGEHADWIEIHNHSGAAVDLAGWYLTDDITDLRKWQFPSTGKTSPLADDGYLLVFADDSLDSVIGNELHASFKLGSGGEYLALIEPDGETVAYQYNPEYPDQSADVSYGIDAGMGDHAYFAVPTPGTPNGQAIADSVRFSVKGGTFTAAFNLELSVSSPTAEIRYTLDGTLPTGSSALYSTPLPITGTTQVRTRTFDAGLTDGVLVSQTYIHLDASAAAFSSDLPLVVLENFNAGWMPHTEDGPERQPCEFIIFEPTAGICSLTNRPAITSRAGIRRRGESTGGQAKPNLSVETWGEIDEDSRSIKPLGMPAESDWILYAPYSIDTALIRNPFIYEISNETGNYAVRTRFVEVFLNTDGGSVSASDYYGVYVFMEKIKVGSGRVDITELEESDNSEPELTGGYLWKKDKADSTNAIDNFSAAGVPMPTKLGDRVLQYVSPSGADMTAIQRSWLTDHINAIDAVVPNGNYESMIDVTAFADHHILNVFANNADGLSVSTFYHKDRNGLVKMGPVWDFDRSMACDNDVRASDPETWGTANDSKVFFHNGGRLWFDSLSRDPEFWIVWVDRWQAMRNGPLSDVAMIAQIEGYRTEIASAAERNFARWPNLLKANAWSDATTWSGKVDGMLNHVLTRAQWIDEQLVDPPAFNQTGGLVASGFQLTLSGPGSKYYTLDASDPRASGGSPSGNTYGSPITIIENTLVKARSWDGTSFVRAPGTWPWSPLSEAMFVVDPAPLAITEIMYHPRPPITPAELAYTASDFEFIEIQNTGVSSCLLVGVQLLKGVEFDLIDGSSTSLGARQYGVLVRNLEAFKVRYPNWASLNMLGTYSGRLSDSGEQIKLGYGLTNLSPLASFDYEDDWFPCTDGEGFSLVLNDPQSDSLSWDSKTAWTHSAGVDGSPGQANPVPLYPQGTVVINEILSHQDTDNPGDWVELHNTTGNGINIGGWFLSDSRGDLKKYTIPDRTTIPANGYMILNEHDHFGDYFALSEHGDSVYLSAGSGGALLEPAYREVVHFGGQERDVTFGRHIRSDGSAVFTAMASATLGAVNSVPRGSPVVIDEIMYHPPVGGAEYLILRNTSGTTIPLYDPVNPSNVWKISGIDFTFPPGVELTPGDSLLLIRDQMTPALFRSSYGVPASVKTFSYSGELNNGAETLVVKKPGTPEVQTGYVPMITVDQVKYNDSAPWPVAADGLGKALGRINSASYGNDVANWQAVDASYIPAMYTLMVDFGSGDGDYSQGTVIPIQAELVPKHSFVSWAGDIAGILNETAATTTLTMPASDVTITASYVSNITYRLTVNAGSGEGEYTAATIVPIESVQTNLSFVKWIGNVSGIADVKDDPAMLTMPTQDITVSALYSESMTFFEAGAEWKYHDKGQDLGTAWRAMGYDDSEWDEGPAQLGYDEGDEATVLSYGGDEENKYITTYFRKNFSVTDPSLVSDLTLRLLRDDGAVVYINGVEVARDRMGTGPVNYLTVSPETQVGGDAEDTFYEFSLPPAALISGLNVMAVEIHQKAVTSSDISFDAELSGFLTGDASTMDGDADGMYDVWETNHFGSTEAGLPEQDLDGDGSVNSNEFIAGTLPGDATSYFKIDGFDGTHISWNAVSGRTYSVYWTDRLDHPFVPIIGNPAEGMYVSSQSSTNPAGFYRIDVRMD